MRGRGRGDPLTDGSFSGLQLARRGGVETELFGVPCGPFCSSSACKTCHASSLGRRFWQACQSKVIKLAAITVSRSSLPCTFTCRTTLLSTWLMVECILNTSSGVLDAESVGEEEAVVNGKCVRKGWRCPCLCSSRGGPGQTARF